MAGMAYRFVSIAPYSYRDVEVDRVTPTLIPCGIINTIIFKVHLWQYGPPMSWTISSESLAISKDLQDLLHNMLQLDPCRRFNIDEVGLKRMSYTTNISGNALRHCRCCSIRGPNQLC